MTLARDWRFNSFPRADSLLKTRRDTRTVRFIGICRCVGIRQIDGTRSNFYLAVRVSGIPRQKSALKPVTFRYKHELDPDGIPQFGLVAEQVEKVNPDLVVRDEDGRVNTVRYEAVNAMLLNEFLKEHRNVAETAEHNRRTQNDRRATAEAD